MRSDDFELLLGLLSRLSVEQKRRLERALAGGDRRAAVCELIEHRLGERPCCVHCGGDRVQRWGISHGLRRWRCRDCYRSFNALTGTALARLRKKEAWLAFAAALSEGLSVKAAAERCAVDPSTSFRWRHRFLRAKIADSEPLGGIIEADDTFFRLSFKGSRRWKNGRKPPGRPAKRRGTRAQTRGMSVEQVPVLVARDRSGAVRSRVLADRSLDSFDAALGPVLPNDAILCSDGAPAIAGVARKHGIRHEPVNLAKGPRIRDKLWHIQNANAHHSRLKAWIGQRKGVATKYLPNYLAWHHTIERANPNTPPNLWIAIALNS